MVVEKIRHAVISARRGIGSVGEGATTIAFVCEGGSMPARRSRWLGLNSHRRTLCQPSRLVGSGNGPNAFSLLCAAGRDRHRPGSHQDTRPGVRLSAHAEDRDLAAVAEIVAGEKVNPSHVSRVPRVRCWRRRPRRRFWRRGSHFAWICRAC